jgi:hypothetical protein
VFKRTFQLLLVACVATVSLGAATDSFVGDWKLIPSKSKFMDVMKVTSLGGNKYEFDFGGGSERIVADGADHPEVYGTMLSATVETPNTWKVVRKKDGRTLLTGTWNLSEDGTTLTDHYTEFDPKGSPSTVIYLYQRAGARPGFAGTWESTMPVNQAYVLQIRPYDDNGLSFSRASEKDIRIVRFDGKDYPIPGRNATQGSTSSARRLDERTLEITDKINGKISRTERTELSPDLKTLMRTIHLAGQRGPNVFVFERQ